MRGWGLGHIWGKKERPTEFWWGKSEEWGHLYYPKIWGNTTRQNADNDIPSVGCSITEYAVVTNILQVCKSLHCQGLGWAGKEGNKCACLLHDTVSSSEYSRPRSHYPVWKMKATADCSGRPFTKKKKKMAESNKQWRSYRPWLGNLYHRHICIIASKKFRRPQYLYYCWQVTAKTQTWCNFSKHDFHIKFNENASKCSKLLLKPMRVVNEECRLITQFTYQQMHYLLTWLKVLNLH